MVRLHHLKKDIGAWSPNVRRLFEIIDNRGLTQSDVLNLLYEFDPDLKITQQRLSKYRLGRIEPGISIVEDLFHVLGYELIVQKRGTPKSD